jgi:hypothetical protein
MWFGLYSFGLDETIIVLHPIGTSMPKEACQANESIDWWTDQRKKIM